MKYGYRLKNGLLHISKTFRLINCTRYKKYRFVFKFQRIWVHFYYSKSILWTPLSALNSYLKSLSLKVSKITVLLRSDFFHFGMCTRYVYFFHQLNWKTYSIRVVKIGFQNKLIKLHFTSILEVKHEYV